MTYFGKQLRPVLLLSLFFMAFVSCSDSGEDASQEKPPAPPTVTLEVDTSVPLTISNKKTYPVSGKCDSNLSGQVDVTIGETNANALSDCDKDNNTFSTSIDATGVVSNPVSMTVTHGSQSVVIEVPNEMVPLGIDTSLPPINLANAATYSVAGDCDSSITDLVNLTLSDEDSSTSLTENLTCANQRFSVELDVSAMRSDFVAISASHRTYRASARVANNMVLLSFNALVEEFNSSTASNYNLSGKCDSSLSGNVVVSVIGTNITESTTCDNDNTFTVDFNASSVTDTTLTFQAIYGNVTVPSNLVPNEMVSLGIDTSLLPINLANAATYSVAGDCDSSITDLVNLTLSDEDSSTSLTENLTCANQRFSVELDVSAMRSDFVAISASHRTYRASARVANNMVLLSFNALVEEFNSSTASNYNLSGKCDSSLSGNVVVFVIGTNITESTTCDNDNTFTVDLDASSVTDITLTFQATYGNVTVSSNSITNTTAQPPQSLGIDTLPPINLANAATYSVAGDCDSSITDLVNLTLSDEDSSTSLTENLTCANQRFSVELDVSAMRSDFVAISASHRTYRASARVANNMVLLSFNVLVEEFSSSTASNYNLSGKCDSSLSGNVVVSVIGTNITESTTCDNDNTFTVDFNASSVTDTTLTFQAIYGNVTVPSNLITNTTAQPPQSLGIDLGDNYSCALTISEGVKCWGDGANGRLGNGATGDKTTPVDVHTSVTDTNPLSGIAAISAGNLHACVLTTNEGVKCWGQGTNGRLGNGTASGHSSTPVDVHTSGTDSNPLSGIAAISTGNLHACALTISEGVKCWGAGANGRLGNGATGEKTTPVDVHTSGTDSNPLSGIAAISIGGFHSCALTTDKVKCWGYGGHGQLGNGDSGEKTTPVDVHTSVTDTNPLSSIKSISSGSLHTCALTTGNKVKCWGYGGNGQLGNGAKSNENTPVDVHTSGTDTNPLSDIAAISSGKYHTCALTTSEGVKCWGQGTSGKLGNGATSDKTTPVDVHTSVTDSNPLSGIAAISAGGDHTCALTISEGVKCWGKGTSGELGNGAKSTKTTPVDVLP